MKICSVYGAVCSMWCKADYTGVLFGALWIYAWCSLHFQSDWLAILGEFPLICIRAAIVHNSNKRVINTVYKAKLWNGWADQRTIEVGRDRGKEVNRGRNKFSIRRWYCWFKLIVLSQFLLLFSSCNILHCVCVCIKQQINSKAFGKQCALSLQRSKFARSTKVFFLSSPFSFLSSRLSLSLPISCSLSFSLDIASYWWIADNFLIYAWLSRWKISTGNRVKGEIIATMKSK